MFNVGELANPSNFGAEVSVVQIFSGGPTVAKTQVFVGTFGVVLHLTL